MIDFLMISTRPTKRGIIEIYPKFIIKNPSEYLMIRGGDFYAIWVEEKGLWSTSEQDAIDIIDRELDRYAKENGPHMEGGYKVLHLWDAESGMIDTWHKYCQKQMRDSFHMLDEKLIFSNTETTRKDYASKRLPYPLEAGDTKAWDRLISVLYSDEERRKIEWAIGSIVSGESRRLQKFMVFYGAAGTGKSTILNIIQQLFEGYTSVFDAKALGSSSNSFALEAFKSNPLVAIQHDGDLSKIEDNTRLNSLVSHEMMTVNEKFKSTYANRFKCFLFMGTNRPVKITDAKSGLIRRLIDVSPTGDKLKAGEYRQLMKQITFELGAIAWHCREEYLDHPDAYDDYIPLSMLGASNDFYNFVMDSWPVFRKEDETTLKAAWAMYKTYCEDARVTYPYSQRAFKEELKNYFREYKERETLPDGTRVRSYYKGFRKDKFEESSEESKDDTTSNWIDLKEQHSLFDTMFADCPAQYATETGTPSRKWANVKTQLSALDTRKIHYVKVPENLIVIDFDIPGPDGEKSFEKNLEEAGKWPPTYAEVSKSGKAIHLHYIYTGDVSQLSSVYGDHIEVKVFTGNSSLRRKLSLCNALPVATLTHGLPLKEAKKIVNFETVKNEERLQHLIQRCMLDKRDPDRINPQGTKPAIDFIYKVLEDAYNDDSFSYDLSIMRNAVLAFAAGSTHQAEYCIKLVNKMRFKSKDILEEETRHDEDSVTAPRVFYDTEVFPNLLLVNSKAAEEYGPKDFKSWIAYLHQLKNHHKPVSRMINPSPISIEELIRNRLVGFNCRRYDNHILYARIMGYGNLQIYNLSKRIVSNGKKNDAFFGEGYNISETDVYDFASAVNKKSLKKLEIEMVQKAEEELTKARQKLGSGLSMDEVADWIGLPSDILESYLNGNISITLHHELGMDWNKPVPEEKWIQVAEYCDDDVIATEAAFHYLSADWTARQILADLAGMTVNDTTNSLTTRIIFDRVRKPQAEFNYRNLAQPVHELKQEVLEFLKDACPEMMAQLHGEEESLLPYFPNYYFGPDESGKSYVSIYQGEEVGEGGNVYAEPGMYGNVGLLDIASMHPHSVIAECLFGPTFTRRFKEIVDGRVSIKHEAWNDVNHILDGKLTPYVQKVINGEITSKQLADALKTAINSVYGLTSAAFENAFRDPRNKDNIVAKRGALFMVDLKHAVQEKGFTVAHIKTDSIKIPDVTPEIIQFVMDFGKRYGYTFEHEATYDKMCLVNDAVYIAKYRGGKKDGQWTATGKQFAVPYVFKKLFSREPIEFRDMCETFSVSGALYLDMNENLPDVTQEEEQLKKTLKALNLSLEDWLDYLANPKEGLLSVQDERTLRQLQETINAGHDYHFVGRVGEFTPVKDGCGGGILLREAGGKYSAATGSKGYRWMESEMVRTLHREDDIDRSYYDRLTDEAKDTISQYGDFEWFVSEDPYDIPLEGDAYDGA